ncbi:unnamed protein product [Durusdinium trenchii]|uniref:Glycylpeptide N-tetradecanoyltransferase n=1 Tax=Durusdinium trenchii TaxID=1381693 RepID=A0ABP0QWV0_9DINO
MEGYPSDTAPKAADVEPAKDMFGDVNDDKELQEIYTLLTENYVEDDVPETCQLSGMREMRKEDVPRVHALVSTYLKKFQLHPELSPEEVEHWMMPRKDVVYCYVRENEKGEINDVCSFYNLPSTILGHEKHNQLRAAYSYWNVATTDTLNVPLAMQTLFVEDFDVFNALDVMENESFLKVQGNQLAVI